VCYLRGTHILTEAGEIAAEDIRIGDTVLTRLGGMRKIRWIGQQSFDCRFIRNNRAKIPVHIHQGALGDGVPARDLFVSPGHSLLVGDTLILARNLVNGVTVTQDLAAMGQPARIDYFQFELDSHDCLLAEGAWAESFADGPGLRAQFHNAAEFFARHPDYVEPPIEQLCAPRPLEGPALEEALKPVTARAAAGLVAGKLEGWIDIVSAESIEGWALDTHHPELPVLLEIWAGPRLLGTALACAHRDDLEAAGKNRGNCAFSYKLPAPLPAAELASLRICRAGDGADVLMHELCRERMRAA
jgi:hypothetical protein